MYNKLAGMTGTAETEAGEFWDIYKLDVLLFQQTEKFLEKMKKIWFIKLNVKNIMQLLKM
jgi:preprotein translocase subunit SecA